MKILHCCLSGLYVEGCGYQENYLTELQLEAGHDVCVFATTDILKDGKSAVTDPGEYRTASGIRIVRFAYDKRLPAIISTKIRRFPELAAALDDYAPDIIFFHGVCSYELLTVAKYCRAHRKTTLLADSHAASYNSATNFASKYIQHMGFYRSWYNRSKDVITKLYYIGHAEMLYLEDILHADPDSMESMQLGGIITPPEERARISAEIRAQLGISGDDIVFLHSGKLMTQKRTRELLAAFARTRDPKLRLLIIGFIPDDLKPVLDDAIAGDDRIKYLGWMSADDLQRYMCAADMYMQPGSLSASLQKSFCSGTPALIYPYESYVHLFGDTDAIVYAPEDEDIYNCIANTDRARFAEMSRAAYEFAGRNFDYREQAERIVREHERRLRSEGLL